jgi:SAM-dependent methyltransferase
MPVTQEDVAWCYRSILRREAESEAVLQRLTTTDDFRELVIKFINSVEFRQKSKTPMLVPPDRPAMRVELDASPAELNRLRDRVREAWTHMGATRPHHSVLSRDDYLPKNINQKAIESFMASGNREALIIKAILERHNFELAHSKTCVEYGCGLGRVTIPIANMFNKIDAYDISPTHLTWAEAYAKAAGVCNIEFRPISAQTTKPLEECDFFYSRIVFQHNPPPIIRELIATSLRCLRPGGVAVFQVPTYAPGYSFRVSDYLSKDQHLDMEMHCIPQPSVFSLIADAGCHLLEVDDDNAIGRFGSWISNTFVIRRPAVKAASKASVSPHWPAADAVILHENKSSSEPIA